MGDTETAANGGRPSLSVKDEEGGLVAIDSLSVASSVRDCMSLCTHIMAMEIKTHAMLINYKHYYDL